VKHGHIWAWTTWSQMYLRWLSAVLCAAWKRAVCGAWLQAHLPNKYPHPSKYIHEHYHCNGVKSDKTSLHLQQPSLWHSTLVPRQNSKALHTCRRKHKLNIVLAKPFQCEVCLLRLTGIATWIYGTWNGMELMAVGPSGSLIGLATESSSENERDHCSNDWKCYQTRHVHRLSAMHSH